jgi:putative hemolysin
MDVTLLEFTICILLICISAFVSASELALFSLSRFQLRSMKENFRASHRRIKRMLGDPAGLLITLLVCTEVLNIAISTLITRVVARGNFREHLRAGLHLPPSVPSWSVDMFAGTLITVPLILVICEVTPKVLGTRANQLVATAASRPLLIIYELAQPIRHALSGFLAWVSRRIGSSAGGSAHDGSQLLKESDFMLMVEEGHREGAIQETELELIRKVFEFDDTPVLSVFTPLQQVQTLSTATTIRGALAALRSQRFSRIPITDAARSEVVGILYAKDLLRAKLQPELLSQPVETMMRKPLFVSPTLRLNSLFRKFKQQRTHMAVVQGPLPHDKGLGKGLGSGTGEALGIVTMSDILETLFEEVIASD